AHPPGPRRRPPLARPLTGAVTAAALVAAAALAAPHPPAPAAAAPAATTTSATTAPVTITSAAAPVTAAGADLPFTTIEAESGAAATDGELIGPDLTQGTVASEASGRRAVRLDAGESVEFTLPRAANAITVAYSVPDGASGSLPVHANGAHVGDLAVTSAYSYLDAPWIPGSTTHQFFANTRLLLGTDLAPGDTVRVTADPAVSPVVIDLADVEQVAPPAEQPQGSVSVLDHGADPTGRDDSHQAFTAAIDEARASGREVWIPQGGFRVGTWVRNVDGVTLRGAGHWHSVVLSSGFIDQQSASGNVGLHDFAVIGAVAQRVDTSPDNFVNGTLGPDSSVSGMWLQHLKVGLWLTGPNDRLVVERNRFYDMKADGLNINGTARDVSVRQNFLRNTGDDALAMWSLHAPTVGSAFEYNTISQPNLANGIAIYGGTDLTVRGNLVVDTNALGSGIAISNQAFAQPFFPLRGTITVDGNELVRTGAMNPNWNHPMGALRVDSYDSAIEARVEITDTTVTDSPWSVFEFVSGGGRGLPVRNVTVDGATVDGAGTVVVQAETPGSVEFANVTATGVGVAGVYNCPFPQGSGVFSLQDGGGNSGWDSEWDDCSSWPGQD
ncbi:MULTISPECIES: glycosyl hydrolase family 28-related protein, partial [unclassified Nocardiopsis]|uniref:glycosyl hydrolase family 28-related protein n=2 Tax=Nocardiopsidaceae TaxID=83676 RepID=UPI00387B8ECA